MKLIPILLLALALSACSKQVGKPEGLGEPGLELTLLHTNDTHSHLAGIDKYGNAAFEEAKSRGGLGRIAHIIKTAKASNDNVLALDAGDQFQGTLYYSMNKWHVISEIDALMPWLLTTLGNHEFDEGCEELAKFLKASKLPVLAANLRPEPGCPLAGANYQPHMVVQVRGVPVGIIGLANDEVKSLAKACPGTKFGDRVQTLQNEVSELQAKGVKHIIVVTHIGLPDDRELARKVDGVDVIVGGHTHSYLGPKPSDGPYPIVEKSPSGQPVLVVTAKRAAQYLGRLDVRFDKAGIPFSWQGQAVEPANADPSDPTISSLIKKQTRSLDKYRKNIIGSHELDLADGMEACRKGECLGGMVAADAMLEFARPLGVDIALFNGGGVRAAMPKGKISLGDILSIFPFADRCVTREYTGAQLLAALEHGVAGEKGAGPALLQVAGLRYVVDPAKAVGKRVQKVEVLNSTGAGEPLDPGKRYSVILTDYLANGGDLFAMLREGKELSSPEPIDVDLLEAYLRKHSPLAMPATGRIVFAK